MYSPNYKNRVHVASTSTGTGNFTLGSAVTGFQDFTVITDNSIVTYCIQAVTSGSPSGDWEVGLGIISSTGTVLARSTVLESSNSNALVDFAAGDKQVFITVASDALVQQSENFLNNPVFEELNSGASSSLSDTNYFFANWYSLIQGSGATGARTTGIDNATYAGKLTAGGTTNRFGVAQYIQNSKSLEMRGNNGSAQLRVRPNLNAGSGTMDIRFAILEWTGTANTVTRDVVNDWTSSDYTTGNFFSGTSLTVVKVGSVSATHNVWTDLFITGSVSTSCNNLIVFVWTEDVPAHANDFVEITKADCFIGKLPRNWTTKVKPTPKRETPGGRLTLTSGVPIETTDITSASTIYYTPFNSDSIWLYDKEGGSWKQITFTEKSLSLSGATFSKPHDVFGYYNNGDLSLEITEWTNDTTRASAVSIQDGFYCKTSDKSRLLLGTLFTVGTGSTSDSASNRFLANLYNRELKDLFFCPNYSNNNANTSFLISNTSYAEVPGVGSRLNFVLPIPTTLYVGLKVLVGGSSGNFRGGLGKDSTTSCTVSTGFIVAGTAAGHGSGSYFTFAAGKHFVTFLAKVDSGSATVYVDDDRFGSAADPPSTYLHGAVPV